MQLNNAQTLAHYTLQAALANLCDRPKCIPCRIARMEAQVEYLVAMHLPTDQQDTATNTDLKEAVEKDATNGEAAPADTPNPNKEPGARPTGPEPYLMTTAKTGYVLMVYTPEQYIAVLNIAVSHLLDKILGIYSVPGNYKADLTSIKSLGERIGTMAGAMMAGHQFVAVMQGNPLYGGFVFGKTTMEAADKMDAFMRPRTRAEAEKGILPNGGRWA